MFNCQNIRAISTYLSDTDLGLSSTELENRFCVFETLNLWGLVSWPSFPGGGSQAVFTTLEKPQPPRSHGLLEVSFDGLQRVPSDPRFLGSKRKYLLTLLHTWAFSAHRCPAVLVSSCGAPCAHMTSCSAKAQRDPEAPFCLSQSAQFPCLQAPSSPPPGASISPSDFDPHWVFQGPTSAHYLHTPSWGQLACNSHLFLSQDLRNLLCDI